MLRFELQKNVCDIFAGAVCTFTARGRRDVRNKGVNLSESVNARVSDPPKTLFSIRFNVLWLYST